jgi:MFS family permease
MTTPTDAPLPNEPASNPAADVASNEKPTNVRWLMFALSSGTSFILYLHRYTWGFIKVDVREETGWSEWQLGFLDSVFNASYAFGQIPSGILCDWFGPHVLLGSIIGLWSLSMAGVALATGFTSMLTARLVFGLTQAGCYPTLNKVSKLWFPMTVRTSVQGWIATFFGRGGGAMSFLLFSTVLLGWCELPWRVALVVMTVIGILFAIVFCLLFRNTPREHPWANVAEEKLITEGNSEVAEGAGSKLKWSRLLRSGNMAVFFFQQFTSAFADNVYVYWIPLFLLTAKNVDVKQAGWMAALPLLGGAVGGMLGGVLQNSLIQRTGNRRWSRSLIGLTGKLLATVFMFVSLGFDSAVVILSIFAVVKFFGDWSQPTVWGTVTDIAGRNAASVFASVNTVGSIAGFVAGPTMGLIIMAYSDSHAVEAESAVAMYSAEDRSQLVKLKYLNVVPGSVTGTVYESDRSLANFTMTDDGDFKFNSGDKHDIESLGRRSRVDTVRGTLVFGAIEKDTRKLRVVADYRYVDYANGWTAVFVMLGGVYLASALSWLFIDCTKKLDVDEDEKNNTASTKAEPSA